MNLEIPVIEVVRGPQRAREFPPKGPTLYYPDGTVEKFVRYRPGECLEYWVTPERPVDHINLTLNLSDMYA